MVPRAGPVSLVVLFILARGFLVACGDRGGYFPNAVALAPEVRSPPSTSLRYRRSDMGRESCEWSSRVQMDAVVDLGRDVAAMEVAGFQLFQSYVLASIPSPFLLSFSFPRGSSVPQIGARVFNVLAPSTASLGGCASSNPSWR